MIMILRNGQINIDRILVGAERLLKRSCRRGRVRVGNFECQAIRKYPDGAGQEQGPRRKSLPVHLDISRSPTDRIAGRLI